jgi:UDP-N-acetylmuramoyl-tripeptide--D-alanyl-D-alanine ligase
LKISISEAAAALGVPSPGPGEVTGVAVDSRRVRKGDLFVAIRGARTDGHNYLEEAFRRGAAAALVSQMPASVSETARLLLVADTVDALQEVAAAVRRRAGWRLVAITGSEGKTTTKDMAASLLGVRLRTGKTPGNQNSAIGLPMALVNLPEGLEIVVVEMGMSHPGELSLLSRRFRPETATVTNVGPAHLEFFGTFDAIARAKAEILDGVPDGGTFAVNADDPRVAAMASRFRGRIVRYALEADADVRASGIAGKGFAGSEFRLTLGSEESSVRLPLAGRHQVSNFVAAAALAWIHGISAAECAEAAGRMTPSPRRGEVITLRSGARIVDDSYNANPASVAAALALLAESGAERRIAVLGDMLELGAAEETLHREVGQMAARCVERLVCVGPRGRWIGEGAISAGLSPARVVFVETADEAVGVVEPSLGPGDAVLVKASRGAALDRVVDGLRG